jgi:hypothetical protein
MMWDIHIPLCITYRIAFSLFRRLTRRSFIILDVLPYLVISSISRSMVNRSLFIVSHRPLHVLHIAFPFCRFFGALQKKFFTFTFTEFSNKCDPILPGRSMAWCLWLVAIHYHTLPYLTLYYTICVLVYAPIIPLRL